MMMIIFFYIIKLIERIECERVWDEKSDILYTTQDDVYVQIEHSTYQLNLSYLTRMDVLHGDVCMASNDKEWEKMGKWVRRNYVERRTTIHGSDWVMKRPLVYVNMQTIKERDVWARNCKLAWFYYSQLLFLLCWFS